MPLHILGLNHNTAPVEIREQVVFNGGEVDRALGAIAALSGVEEAVLLSTCNRTEIYVESSDSGLSETRDWLVSDQGLEGTAVESLFSLNSEEAILRHFSGLNPEYTACLVENKFGAPHVTRCAGTRGDDVLSARFQRKSLVERCDAVYLHERYT